MTHSDKQKFNLKRVTRSDKQKLKLKCSGTIEQKLTLQSSDTFGQTENHFTM